MSNTVITNYTDLNGPSSKADSSVVVIVNKDGSLSVDQNLLGTLMGTDGSQGAGISVVRVGHEGRPDDATDSESDDEKVPHVTLSVDSYYNEPNSIIKYDSGAEMLQSLRIETRENSLVGFQNDHCYTPLTSPGQGVPQKSDSFSGYDEPVIEITHTPPPKPVPQSKKITILEQQIIPKGRKIVINPTDSTVLLKGKDVLSKPLPALSKSKQLSDLEKSAESTESSSISSGDSIPDRDSDSDYKDTKDRSLRSVRKSKVKPRILQKATPSKGAKLDLKVKSRLKSNKNLLKKDIKEKLQLRSLERKQSDSDIFKETILPIEPSTPTTPAPEIGKVVSKQTPKPVKKEKKPPAHMTALLSDMTSLFSTPDVIRRVSTDGKTPVKPEKEQTPITKKGISLLKSQEPMEAKLAEGLKASDSKAKIMQPQKVVAKPKVIPAEKVAKGFDLIPQLDEVSLAQILQDTTGITPPPTKTQPSITTANTLNSPGLAGPLSPTLDLLGGLQPEEEGLTEDLLMHVAQLVESSENLQEVIDKQVLGKVDTGPPKTPVQSPFQQAQATPYTQTPNRPLTKSVLPQKNPIEIVRRDGRVITLPPIEAPATRSSKRKSQMETVPSPADTLATPTTSIVQPMVTSPDPQTQHKQYINKAKLPKKPDPIPQLPIVDKLSAESQESWNSEDDPYRLWCICRQPHNNRFMICCDSCEDWFHGKCVNITKAMGQQMEERGIEWRCPNCVKKTKPTQKQHHHMKAPHSMQQKTQDLDELLLPTPTPVLITKDSSKTGCIVCKRPARASSIYCSDACILKHAQDSLGSQASPTKQETEPGKSQEKPKSDSRVIVYERKSGRLLAGPNAPTAENLKTWLQKNPTFEVVRPGTLHTIKPNLIKRKSTAEVNKIQTTLNFERIPRKAVEGSEVRGRGGAPSPPHRPAPAPAPAPAPHRAAHHDTPRPSTSTARPTPEPRKPASRVSGSRSHSSYDKAPSVSPSTPRRKDAPDAKRRMDSTEPIRENVRKSLQEQISVRLAEGGRSKFTDDQIQQFAVDTEYELYEFFGRDVGMKYKAKYRSLMFNIKDRKNLSLWQKICDRKITPSQLVRLSPDELASQELAQWREEEAKHQLELIKKSELDLLAASKTYVLKTHKGEEVMETKESVQTELDPEVPVEDLVIALNDSTVGEEVTNEAILDKADSKLGGDKKKERENSSTSRSKKSSRESKRDSESKKSRSSRRRSDGKEREERSTRRSGNKSARSRSLSKDRAKEKSDSKEKGDTGERSRRRSRSRSRAKSRRRSKTRSRSRERSRKLSPAPAPPPRDRQPSPPSPPLPPSPPPPPRRRRSERNKHSSSTEEKHRSRSQEHLPVKPKQDSTDSDSVERPKSAMLKEVHPEYDPHEPMITSAFSEEDLRKSGGESYDDTYKAEVVDDYGDDAAYDPAKEFSIDAGVTGVVLPTSKSNTEKVSEAESDQEPSSTVENSSVMVWNGCINMVDVARFYVAAHEVSGSASDLEEDLTTELDIVGRINPDTVWEYIGKMKRANNKDIIVLKLQAANDEEKMQYIALYSYLSSRNRLGVVKVSNTATVKDFYIVPLPANTPLPSVLLPLDGPGLGEAKTHLLLAIVIRQRKKRPAPAHIPKDIIPTKVARTSRKRSYTPPMAPRSATPPAPRLPLPTYTSPALSTSVKDKIAASLAAADDEEAYSPGSSSSGSSAPPPAPAAASAPAPAPAAAAAAAPAPAPASTLRTKMEELNRQIEEQKQQILKMAQADSSVPEEEEAYSPSRPMTPPAEGAAKAGGAAGGVGAALADIALPSNLQEILATIKQRSEGAADLDIRSLPLPP